MRKRRKVERGGREGCQTRKDLNNPILSSLQFCLLNSVISQTTNNVLLLKRAKTQSFRPIEFKIKMLANVTFPSSERFRVQCIPELSIGSLHFPALFTSYTFLLPSLFTSSLPRSGSISDNVSFNSAI